MHRNKILRVVRLQFLKLLGNDDSFWLDGGGGAAAGRQPPNIESFPVNSIVCLVGGRKVPILVLVLGHCFPLFTATGEKEAKEVAQVLAEEKKKAHMEFFRLHAKPITIVCIFGAGGLLLNYISLVSYLVGGGGWRLIPSAIAASICV